MLYVSAAAIADEPQTVVRLRLEASKTNNKAGRRRRRLSSKNHLDASTLSLDDHIHACRETNNDAASLNSHTTHDTSSYTDSYSSLDSWPVIVAETTTGDESPVKQKQVRFRSTVEIHEFSVTVGDHPAGRDSCPLTLTWEYAARTGKTQTTSANRPPVHRMSLAQRRQRVADTLQLSLAQVHRMEIHMVQTRIEDLIHLYDSN